MVVRVVRLGAVVAGVLVIAAAYVACMWLLPQARLTVVQPVPLLSTPAPAPAHYSPSASGAGASEQLLSYDTTVPSPSPGGAVTPDTTTPQGAGSVDVAGGILSVSPLPVVMVSALIGVLVLWSALRWLGSVLRHL